MIELKLICTVNLTARSYNVKHAIKSESTNYGCLNVKKPLDRGRPENISISDCNETQTQNHLVHTPSSNHLAKLAKLLSCVMTVYDCMFLSC